MTKTKPGKSKSTETSLYKKAWKKWGDLQWLMVIEECSELQKAIVKYMREKTVEREAHIAEEIADVEIMIGQLRSRSKLFNSQADYQKRKKLVRLSELLTPYNPRDYLSFKTSWGKVTIKKDGFKKREPSPMSRKTGEWLD